MTNNNVVIKRQVAATNIDSYNRSAIHTADLPNGSVFALEGKNATEREVWDVTAPTANQAGLWMATAPEVMYLNVDFGGSLDPRLYVNKAGKVFDVTYLVPKDIVEMTGDGITGIATAKYLVADTTTTLKSATAAPTAGIALKKIGTDTFKIGTGALAPAAIPTYIFEVVAN